VAPVGLSFYGEPARAFDIGCDVAAITHGHPSGCLSAGCLAALVAGVIAGQPLKEASQEAVPMLRQEPGHEECLAAVRAGIELASGGRPSPEEIESLGGGWVGEEALAISLCCALCSPDDYATAILLAVNQGGDSDSTGAITGNILGALLGKTAIPRRWLARLELRTEIEALAEDLLVGFRDSEEWRQRYPGC